MTQPLISTTSLVRRGGINDWVTWIDRSRSPASSPQENEGRPGLWRVVRAEGDGLVTAFACPPIATFAIPDASGSSRVEGTQSSEGDSKTVEDMLFDWACATAQRAVPEGWSAPDRDRLMDTFDPDRLIVRVGSNVARGELECAGQTLRLRFAELVRLDPVLSEPRRDWIRELCLEAQTRWQWARFSVDADRVSAEVDLSGAPIPLLDEIFGWAFDALVFSVGWALPALALVADEDLSSPEFDRGPAWRVDDGMSSSSSSQDQNDGR